MSSDRQKVLKLIEGQSDVEKLNAEFATMDLNLDEDEESELIARIDAAAALKVTHTVAVRQMSLFDGLGEEKEVI